MAFKQISSIYFLADTKEDLANIPTRTMGAECFVIKDAMEYKQTSTGEWYPQAASKVLNDDMITFEQIQSDWNQDDKTAVDYIKNKPFGAEIIKEEIENIYHLQDYDGREVEVVYEDGTSQNGVVNRENQGTGTWYYYLKSQETENLIWDSWNYNDGQWYGNTPVYVYAIITEVKTLSFDNLPIKRLDYISQVNPVEHTIVEGGSSITAQQAYDYAVSVNNNFLTLVEQYNNLIIQLNAKGYVSP